MKFRGLFVGLTTIDIQYFVDVFPGANKKVKTGSPEIMVGGPAANAAVAFSALNKGVYFISAAGKHGFSDFITQDFQNHNLEFIDLLDDKSYQPVIASVVTAENGDRNIFTHHPKTIHPCIAPKQILDEIKPEIILLDGFYPEFSVALAREAKQRKIPVVLDCGSWKPQFQELLSLADIAICSSDFYPPLCSSVNEVFNFLEKCGIGAFAISRGAESILVSHAGNKGEIAVDNIISVDTLGAGDILHGAFCYYYLFEHQFNLALTKAAKLASFSCKYRGTREWLSDLDVYLTKNN
ncbi:PfkB family carbohydrate kinase [Maribellus sp. YY47]|uniref:PfkB family carbohydrate kinase n=1 Tax=Maribellus sp. YY47 TaxID=2929486 RepID=UPI002001BD3D|nr:PfkB family carbohydrate kinase [Maribellus sp. YY47]MCK3686152.1 PfkB family carbohydrate kinase [Maribellus sp. YY47]